MTNENLSELMAALSDEGDGEPGIKSALADERLKEILVELSHRPPPVHSAGR